MKKFASGLAIALLTLIADQFSKWLIVKYFAANFINVKVTEFLNLVLVYNKGISFGLFNQFNYSNYLFCFISVLIIGFLFSWLKNSKNLAEIIALGLIIGGAIGNVIDRIIYPGVIDFLQFHWLEYYWPSFNIADSAIFIGVCILMIFSVDFKSKQQKNNKE